MKIIHRRIIIINNKVVVWILLKFWTLLPNFNPLHIKINNNRKNALLVLKWMIITFIKVIKRKQ